MTDQVLLLLADDELLVRLVMQETLEEGGFAVLQAVNGSTAMAMLEKRHRDIAAVITDIRLGSGPDGWALAHRARELNASVAVIYVTGDSAADWPANGVPKSVVLQKPFAGAQLVTAVATLLNQTGGDAVS
ncbi:MAG: response regulator [Sphingobium sp.]|nr:response regulator [Sphingobium sp.]